MPDKDYDQKRAECWEEYCETHPLCNTPVMRLNFDWTFNRAYILGKQEETVSQAEIEDAAEKFADEIKIPPSAHGVMVPFINGLAHDSYLQGARDFLGKQRREGQGMIRMQGWMCRDKIWDKELQDSDLCVAMEKPERDQEMGCWVYMGYFIPLKTELYPDLTWDDEPVEVEILVKKIM